MRMLRQILATPKGAIGLLLVLLTLATALLAPWLAPADPFRQDLRARLAPPGTIGRTGLVHHLGADALGRDILSRMIHGARISVLVGVSAVLVSGVVGTLLGLTAGYWGGWLGEVLMRLVDLQLAIPMILFAIAWIAFFGPGLASVVIVIGAWGWVQYARLVRGMTLSLKETQYVQASEALGARDAVILFQHILPNLIGPVIVMATLQLGEAVLLESALSFLGLGVQAPIPTWGGMVSDGRSYIDTAWWTVVFPGAAITLFVLGANFLGDALRDHLDPTTD